MKNFNSVFALGLIVVLYNCVVFGILKMDLDNKIYFDILETSFLKIFSRLDFFFGFIIPLGLLLFFLLTTKLMFVFFEVNSSIKSFIWLLPVVFFPALVATTIAYFVLLDIDNYSYVKLSKGLISPYNIYSKYYISLYHLKLITMTCYYYLYIHMGIIFVKIYKINVQKSIIIAIAPSLLVLLFKFSINYFS